MLTKTRKWILVFILAFVALFLVACDGEEEDPDPIKPENLTVEVVAFVGNKATVVGKAPMKVEVTSTTVNADLGVNWTSSDDKIAVVDGEGIVSGKKAGYATITATSKHDEAVKASVEIRVYDSAEHINNDLKALLDASEQLQAAMPEFVDKTMDLPKPANAAMSVVYKDHEDNIILNGKYLYANYTNDRYESINVEMSYGTEKMAFPYQLRIVKDVDDNDFNAIADAQQYVEKYLAIYKSGVKIYGNVTFPRSITELKTIYGVTHEGRDVSISWKSLNTPVITNTGEYIRPNDDTVVSLETYFVSNNISAVNRHPVNVKGYTPDEIIEEILNSIPDTVQAKNLVLPSYYAKFSALLTWETNDAEIITAGGKTNPYLEEKSEVTLTATVKYSGSSSKFAFEKEGKKVVTALPAANDSQAVALELSTKFETELPNHFPYGEKNREGGNTFPAPATVGGTGPFKEVPITWTAEDETLFNDDLLLLKQYLRYHETKLTFSVTIGEHTSTGEVTVNTGVAELANTIYAGGNMYSRAGSQAQPYDELHQMSPTDGQSGMIGSTTNVHGWSGTTFYTDVEKDGLVTRYQFFVSNLYSVIFKPGTTYSTDANGVINGGATNPNGSALPNRQTTFINLTDNTIKVPVAITDNADRLGTTPEAREAVLKNYPATNVTKSAGGQAFTDTGLVYKLYRSGFITSADGTLTMASGSKTPQEVLYQQYKASQDTENPMTSLPNYIEIGAGQIAYNKGDVGTASLHNYFGVPGTKVFVKHFSVPA